MQKFLRRLERFSQSLLSPLSYLSAAGLLLAAGALLTSTALSGALPLLQWGPVRLMGRILYKCLSAVISNLSVLFCTGLAASLAKQEKHQAAFIALMSYFIYLTAGNVTLAELGLLAQPDGLTGLYGAGQTSVLGIQTVDTGVFGGVLLGLLTAHVYDHTCKKAHKGILGGVFSGERWSFTCMAALAAVLGFGACFVWPPVQKAIAALTGFLAASGNIGLFLYGFLERLLIPTGLHHLVYMPFQFSQLGGQLMVGSVTYTGAYVVMMTEYNLNLPFSDGIVWMYTGFTKTFGYFGIAAAFIFCARRGSRKKTALQLLPLAFTASLASVTEPMDFLFCFSAPVLWLAHAAISGAFIVLLHLCHVTAFTSNLPVRPAPIIRCSTCWALPRSRCTLWSSRRSSKRWICPRRADARRSLSGRRRHRWTMPGWKSSSQPSAGGRTSARWTTALPACGSRCRMRPLSGSRR